MTGAMLGGLVVILGSVLLLSRHRINNTDYVLYDAGWQFQMVLNRPLTLDAGRVTAGTALFAAK